MTPLDSLWMYLNNKDHEAIVGLGHKVNIRNPNIIKGIWLLKSIGSKEDLLLTPWIYINDKDREALYGFGHWWEGEHIEFKPDKKGFNTLIVLVQRGLTSKISECT